MENRIRFPIRLKVMLTLLIVVTGVVALITFSTANLFQGDRKAYINGLTSMVALGTAEEANSVLTGYRARLQVYARTMDETSLSRQERIELSRAFFEDSQELVGVSMVREGDEPTTIFNGAILEANEISRETLVAFEAEHPLPVSQIAVDAPYVVNSSVAEALPMARLAFRLSTEGEEPLLVTAWVSLEELLRLTSRFSAYETTLTDSQRYYLAHSDHSKIFPRQKAVLQPEAAQLRSTGQAGMTVEYREQGKDMIAGYADVGFAGVTAVAEIPRSAAYLPARDLVQRLVIVASALLMLAVLASVIWAHRLTRPVERLSDAAKRIGKGNFDVSVSYESRDEIGNLALSFNQMAGELKSREEALGEAQAQLVQSEKMAAFGQLGAGIAHEVKNPLAGILACAQLCRSEVDHDSQAHKDLALIEKETKRCKQIIENLLKFARQEKAAMNPTNVNEVIDDATAIVNHQMELNKVKLLKDLDAALPSISGNRNQLQQVFMNMMINAQQAMEGTPGQIHVTSRFVADGAVEVVFKDTGPGVPEDVKQKVFEPFFTTKPGGKGTGLGLSVSFGIVRDHGGSIRVESELGEGAAFIITLPALDENPLADPVATSGMETADLSSGLVRV